jgi:GTPase SAR1 family protein
MFELTEANYNFDPVKFNVDESLGDHIMEPFPNKSFFWVICGKPGSGKTSLLINTLISKGPNRVYRKVFDKILLVMPSNSRASLKNSPFEDLPDDQQFEKFDENVVNRIMAIRDEFGGKKEEPIKTEFEHILQQQPPIIMAPPTKKPKKNRNMLLILDDITAYLKDDPSLLIELTTNRRHLKLSICCLVQFLRSIPRPVRFQITDITIFKPANELDTKIVEEEFIQMPSNDFKTLKRFVWQNKHDYLFISKDTETYYKNLNRIKFKQKDDILENIEDAEESNNKKVKTKTKNSKQK